MTNHRDQLFFDVFTTALEGGINYWATVETYKLWVNPDMRNPVEDLLHFHADITDIEDDAEVPADHPVQPVTWDPSNRNLARCGHCGRAWDDGKPTTLTPVPGGRCPFEQFHSPTYRIDRTVIQRGFGLAVSADWRNKLGWSSEAPPVVITEATADWDYDAGDADMIVQLGLFGDVRYG